MKRYILAIDQGTTGSTALLVEGETLKLVGKETVEFPQIYPRPGEVEHSFEDIWQSVKKSIVLVLTHNKISAKEILSIGITNQRETICPFDSKTGTPLSNALVWQDRRTTDFCEKIKSEGKESWIREKTGLPMDPYFSASKMTWLLNNNQKIKKASQEKRLRWGTIDTCLLYRLTGGESFATDATNASRYLLMNLDKNHWDDELLSFFHIEKESLPEIKDSFGYFGETKNVDFLPDGIPIASILGDQQAALLGQAGIAPGDIKCTYGTGAFMVLNTGTKRLNSEVGLLTTLAYRLKGESIYALEGSSYIAGAAVQWLRDQLGFFTQSAEVEALARQVKNLEEMEHLLFMPYFSGIGSPHWKPCAHGTILGLTRDTGKAHIAKATLDGIAFSIDDLLLAFRRSSPYPINRMKVDGGATGNNLLLQTQADISDLPIVRPQIIETTAYGVALGALVGLGKIELKDIPSLWKEEKTFLGDHQRQLFYQKKRKTWDDLVHRLYY